jgi:hypothetical protein
MSALVAQRPSTMLLSCPAVTFDNFDDDCAGGHLITDQGASVLDKQKSMGTPALQYGFLVGLGVHQPKLKLRLASNA